MTRIFNEFKKSYLWSVFGPFSPFLGKKSYSFSKTLALSRTSLCEALTPCKVSEKTHDQLPIKLLEGWTEGR